jgi:hypothetical protein
MHQASIISGAATIVKGIGNLRRSAVRRRSTMRSVVSRNKAAFRRDSREQILETKYHAQCGIPEERMRQVTIISGAAVIVKGILRLPTIFPNN